MSTTRTGENTLPEHTSVYVIIVDKPPSKPGFKILDSCKIMAPKHVTQDELAADIMGTIGQSVIEIHG